MRKLTLIIIMALTAMLNSAAAQEIMLGYKHIGFEAATAEVHATSDYYLIGKSLATKHLRYGLGYGLFRHTFESTDPASGEIEGFSSETDSDGAIAFFMRYRQDHFYVHGVVARPTFESDRSRVVSRKFIRTAPPQNGFPGSDVFYPVYQERDETEDNLRLYLTAGVSF